jgi:CheY-like chemotaxis protein
MDLQMPVMDGLTSAKAIRNYEREQGLIEIPIIAMTAHALDSDRELCNDAGMNDFLVKPVGYQEFKQTVAKYIDK